MHKPLAAALLGATLLAGTAHAAQDRPQRDPLARADANSDGAVTRDEFVADIAARFAKADKNGDGKLSADERPNRGGRMMERADTDGDGALSLDEQRAQALQRFTRLDANGDGSLDQAERDAMRDRMGRGGPGARGDMPPPPPSDAD